MKMRKRILSTLIAMCMLLPLLPLTAMAEDSDFTINSSGVLTKYNGTGGDVTIPDGVTSIGADAFKNCSGLTGITIPEGVTGIGNYAFRGCTDLASINIPEGVTNIGSRVFWECTSLESITIPASVTKIDSEGFKGCESLTDITISDGVESIGTKYAFSSCTNLKSVTLPASVTTIEAYAFNGCTSLESVNIPEKVTSIGRGAFINCENLKSITIPAGATNIGTEVFKGCAGLESATILADVTEIFGDMFNGCASLKSITIPDTVTNIGGNAFNGCESLTSVTIPDKVTSINGYAFQNCTGLASITIPTSVTRIYGYAFRGCTGLTDVYYGGSEGQWGKINIDNDYDGNKLLKTAKIYYYRIGAAEIADSGTCGAQGDNLKWTLYDDGQLTITGAWEMASWTDKSSVPWYKHRETIKQVTIGTGVTGIGNFAFQDCAMTNVTVPGTVKSIGESSFDNCTALTDVYYGGSETQWNAIQISTEGNDPLQNGIIRYNTTGVAKFEESGTCGANLKWILYDDGMLIITGTGNMKDYEAAYDFRAPWSKKWVTQVAIADGVTRIGDRAFCDRGMTSIIIPDTVKSIGGYAFYNCGNLISATIPEGITSIGQNVFQKCVSLKSVTIPAGVKIIAADAFDGCTSLESATILGDVTSIGDRAFQNCKSLNGFTIPSTVTSIGESAFSGCESLTDAAIPEGVESLGKSAFAGCKSLTSMTIPNAITTLDHTFYGCGGLTSVTIHADVTSIGNYTFNGCSSLTDVYYAGSESDWDDIDIGDYANDALKPGIIHYNRTGPAQVVATGDCGASGSTLTWTLYDDGQLIITGMGNMNDWTDTSSVPWNAHRETIQQVTIEEGITGIGKYAFNGCTGLESVTIPAGVTGIGEYAFEGCTALTDVYYAGSETEWSDITINNNGNNPLQTGIIRCNRTGPLKIVDSGYCGKEGRNLKWFLYDDGQSIIRGTGDMRDWDPGYYEYSPWRNNGQVKQITIKEGVTSIGRAAFNGCSGLKSVTIPDGVTSIGRDAFNGCTGLTDVYYAGSETEWSDITINNNGNNPLQTEIIRYNRTGPQLTLVYENGTDADKVTDVNAGEQFTFPSPNPTREGYDFMGWKGTDEKYYKAGDKVTVFGDVTYTANWEELKYTVTLDYGNGADNEVIKVKSGDKFTFPTPDPTREGYDFKGWKATDETIYNSGDEVEVTEDVTYTAIWEKIVFQDTVISYDNGKIVIKSDTSYENVKLLIAEYSSDGILIGVSPYTIDIEAQVPFGMEYTANENYTTKIMLWNSLDKMIPLAAAENYENTQTAF